jgi:D-beta-D-heptose 7-phosphate kinase/D-beta-D-heptose 1-phosphate adenosyltransferase
LIKPNLKEAYLAAHMDARNPLDDAAARILSSTHTQYLMVTRSEDGISLFENGVERKDFPVTAKEVKDVTGAGDTVLAMLAISIANELPLSVAIHFANVAASIAIEQFGCARITLPQLAKRLLEIDASNKIFDADHIHALQAALKDHPCSLVSLSGNAPPTSQIVHELAKYKKATGHSIMAAIQGKSDESVIGMLAALYPIDYILLNTDLELIQKSFPKLNQLAVTTGN